MSAARLWNRDGHLVAVTVTRTEGDDLPAGHCEAYVISTGATEFVPVADLVAHHDIAEIERIKHSKET